MVREVEEKYSDFNFQVSTIYFPKCKGCEFEDCVVLYDSHHDQFFGRFCGVVVMECGVFCFDDFVFYDF